MKSLEIQADNRSQPNHLVTMTDNRFSEIYQLSVGEFDVANSPEVLQQLLQTELDELVVLRQEGVD
jgi:hypothetical protein